jgi:hypothetical protein
MFTPELRLVNGSPSSPISHVSIGAPVKEAIGTTSRFLVMPLLGGSKNKLTARRSGKMFDLDPDKHLPWQALASTESNAFSLFICT